MAVLSFGEIFCNAVDSTMVKNPEIRKRKHCLFRGTACTKGSVTDPLGICSLTDGISLTTICPYRFQEGNRLFRDAATLAFGSGKRVTAVPELRILRVPEEPRKRIGKVDFVLGLQGPKGGITDFCAVEVQSVYVSGMSMRPHFNKYLATGVLSDEARRRPDFRSSAQKRLMPQLDLKVPVFRRWGKKFFVAVDESFFQSLPRFRETNAFENSEVTWLVYPFSRKGVGDSYQMGEPRVVFTEWSDVKEALREGDPPSPSEIMDEIGSRSDAISVET